MFLSFWLFLYFLLLFFCEGAEIVCGIFMYVYHCLNATLYVEPA